MDLVKAMTASASGLRAQSVRMRVISENIANQNSMGDNPGDDPYRRKVVSFRNQMDRALGVNTVVAEKVQFDKSDFGLKYDPGNPAANAEGYVRTPNVSGLVEMMDFQQAQRSYKANINAMEGSRKMTNMTIDLLR